MVYAPPMIYAFGPCELDVAAYELRVDGKPRDIEPQVFTLLSFLVANRDRLVSKDELIEKVWDGRVVSDAALSSRIKSARQALGDDGESQRYIKTTYGRGYRFIGRPRRRTRRRLCRPPAQKPTCSHRTGRGLRLPCCRFA